MRKRIGDINSLIGVDADRNFMIVGAGSTVKEFKDKINDFIVANDIITIGINKMTHILDKAPDYHMWTNNQRLRDFQECIMPESRLIFGNGIKEENKPDKDYYTVDYIDFAFVDRFQPPSLVVDEVQGSFRCCGHLALYMAKLMGAKKIYYVGADGYSLPYKGNQHCYGEGLTDSTDIEYEKAKDNVFNLCLHEIAKVVDFEILTPTVHEEYYNAKPLMATDKQ